ncbi:hypothetical protein C0J52_04475 [Blattella germanica]|nr:hypothetical protein C0J52_04475 [Blattella germanica]
MRLLTYTNISIVLRNSTLPAYSVFRLQFLFNSLQVKCSRNSSQNCFRSAQYGNFQSPLDPNLVQVAVVK